MNQDTIPSQLPPITIPSALGPVGRVSNGSETPGFSPVLKWLLLAVVILVIWRFV